MKLQDQKMFALLNKFLKSVSSGLKWDKNPKIKTCTSSSESDEHHRSACMLTAALNKLNTCLNEEETPPPPPHQVWMSSPRGAIYWGSSSLQLFICKFSITPQLSGAKLDSQQGIKPSAVMGLSFHLSCCHWQSGTERLPGQTPHNTGNRGETSLSVNLSFNQHNNLDQDFSLNH